MSAFGGKPLSSRQADAAAGADDHGDFARQGLLGRHAAQLGFFQRPVFDVEGFLPRQRHIAADRLGATHDRDRAIVKFGGNARLALVLAKSDHAQPGDQDHRRIGVAHGRAVLAFAGFVIGCVVPAIVGDAAAQFFQQRRAVSAGRVPVDMERFDLGAQEVIRAGGAQLSQPRGIDAVDETHDVGVILHCADEAVLL